MQRTLEKWREQIWKCNWTLQCRAKLRNTSGKLFLEERQGSRGGNSPWKRDPLQSPTTRKRASMFTHTNARLTSQPGRALERLKTKIMKITLPKGGFNSMSHYHLVRKPIPMLQEMKILGAKAGVDKSGRGSRNSSAWQESRAKIKQEVIDEARQEGKTVHFCNAHGIVSQQKTQNRKSSNIQRTCCTTRRRCER